LLIVIGSLLLEDHVLLKSMYEAQKLLRALKMTYEHIHACPKGYILFRKKYAEAKYCPNCKSSRFMEVDFGDGQKR
jgi:predicted Zn-ribbon and HTH transcriptional regulator